MIGCDVVKAWHFQYYHQQHQRHASISFQQFDPMQTWPIQKAKARLIFKLLLKNGIEQQMGRHNFTSQPRFFQFMPKAGRKLIISKLHRI